MLDGDAQAHGRDHFLVVGAAQGLRAPAVLAAALLLGTVLLLARYAVSDPGRRRLLTLGCVSLLVLAAPLVVVERPARARSTPATS